jgi:hypothetical protein
MQVHIPPSIASITPVLATVSESNYEGTRGYIKKLIRQYGTTKMILPTQR